MADDASFPRLWARTRRWTLGEPRTITVISDRPDGGHRVLFLRALAGDDPRTGLWVIDVASSGIAEPERLLVDPAAGHGAAELPDAERSRRERVRESAVGVVSYSADRSGRWILTAIDGRWLLIDADIDGPNSTALVLSPDAFDARIDPTGRLVAFCTARKLAVLCIESGDVSVIAGSPEDPPEVFWGRAEHVAGEEMHRFRGFWWAPDGRALLVQRADESQVLKWWISSPIDPGAEPRAMRYPAAGTANAEVTLWRISVSPAGRSVGSPIEIPWNRKEFDYLAAVSWPTSHDPVIAIQRRDQRVVRWLSVASDGSTSQVAEDRGDPWVELHPGAPGFLGDELVRIADVDGGRRLLVGHRVVSPPSLHVRSICGVLPAEVVVTANSGDPASLELWGISGDGAARPISSARGVHSAAVGGGNALVVSATSLDRGQVTEIVVDGHSRARIASRSLPLLFEPTVDIFTAGDGIQVGLVLPRRSHAEALPVVMNPYGGPHAQQVLANRRMWLESQWWADQGFAVIVADGRGMPGVSVQWEHAVHGDFSEPVLADQVAALEAAAARAAEAGVTLDLQRVGIRGWSFGGFLAALAVLRRPDIFHVGVAGAPVTDQRLYDTHYTERYLGTDTTAASYRTSSLIEDALALMRPLMIIHGMADDNVVAAHSLALSQALTQAGRPHTFLPLSGVTHMTPQETVAENLQMLQLRFIATALGVTLPNH